MLNNIHNINNGNPFKVPENYFEDFKKDIMLQVASQEPQKVSTTPKISIWKRSISWGAVAATFVGALLTFNTIFKDPQQMDENKTKAQKILTAEKSADENEFYQYIEEQSMRGSFNETLLNNEDIY